MGCHDADPGFMQEVQVDRGAIRFVLGGAHVMCPGLTSKGGRVDPALEAETPVVSHGFCSPRVRQMDALIEGP